MAIRTYNWTGGSISYYARGWGDPLVLVHGIYPGASHREFDRNIDALAKDFTIHAPDLLGFGGSDKPRINYTAQVYEHLLRDFLVQEVGPAYVVASGISSGPAVALAVYNDPLVKKLVLIDPPIHADSDAGLRPGARLQRFLLGSLAMGTGLYEVASSPHELREFLRTRYTNPKQVTDEQVMELHETASQPQALHAYVSHMTGAMSIDVFRWLRYVRCPVLVIWGEQAGEPPTALLQPAAWSKGKRIEVIPQSSHWVHAEQSAKVNELIRSFLLE